MPGFGDKFKLAKNWLFLFKNLKQLRSFEMALTLTQPGRVLSFFLSEIQKINQKFDGLFTATCVYKNESFTKMGGQ